MATQNPFVLAGQTSQFNTFRDDFSMNVTASHHMTTNGNLTSNHSSINSSTNQKKKKRNKNGKSKICSCLDVLRRAFLGPAKANDEQMMELPVYMKQMSCQNVNGGYVTDASTVGTTVSQMFQNQQIQQQQNEKQVIGSANNNMEENNQNNDQQYIFRFLQRYDYLAKKFAPKRDFSNNRNNRHLSNIIVKTADSEPSVKYCEGINGNLFLLKYFKYECNLCMKLCTQTLVTECCKTTLCIRCVHEFCEQFTKTEQQMMKNCLFCNQNVTKMFLIRDPYRNELADLAKKTFDKYKRASMLSDNQNNSELFHKSMSAVKPQKLHFYQMQDDENDLNTASSLKRKINFYGNSAESNNQYCPFEDILFTSAKKKHNESISMIESPEAQEYDTKAGFSTSATNNNNNHNQRRRSNSRKSVNNNNNNNAKYQIDEVIDFSISELPKQIGSRKRINNSNKQNKKDMTQSQLQVSTMIAEGDVTHIQKMEDEESYSNTKRVRKNVQKKQNKQQNSSGSKASKENDENMNSMNIGLKKSSSTALVKNRSKRIRKT